MAYDPFPLQVIAHGTTDGNHAGLTSTVVGVAIAATGAGVYTLTLDPAALGDVQINPAALRVSVTPLDANKTVQIVKTSTTVTTVNTFAATTVSNAAADCGFDFVLYRVPGK